MAELFVVRHGQASFGEANYDCLSPLGIQQSVWLGEYFAERTITFDRVITGSLNRHRQTADAIGRGLRVDLPCEQHDGLNEYDFRSLYWSYLHQHRQPPAIPENPDKRAFYKVLKCALQAWSNGQLTGDLPETWPQFENRVSNALSCIQERVTKGQRILAISSGGPISMLLGQVLDLLAEKIIELNMQLKNASVCHFYINKQRINLASFNGITHLDRPERWAAITYG